MLASVLVSLGLALEDVPVAAEPVVSDILEVGDKDVAVRYEAALAHEQVGLLLEGQPGLRLFSHGAPVLG